MKRLLFSFIILFFVQAIYAHPWKPSHYVIVDTDGGIDDIRAITLLLASPDVRVLAITVSPGVLDAENAYRKVKSLLNTYHHEGIPVGINRSSDLISSGYPVALGVFWGNEENLHPSEAPSDYEVINYALSNEKTPVSFICLGGLNTAYNGLRNIPEFSRQVREILWSADGAHDTKGFNYNIDTQAAKKILKEFTHVKIIMGAGEKPFYDDQLLKSISEVNTRYASEISETFKSEIIKSHPYSFMATDEMVPLYLQFPGIFVADSAGRVAEFRPAVETVLKDKMIVMLSGETVAANQVIKNLPTDPSFYFDDIKPSVKEIIDKYGMDEWSSGVQANELHRHLGVFAIIGVKMGIRAREYFDTGVDEFSVTSFAGSEPPLSCMNDGLQVSTGATPGHGLLTVRTDTILSASAEFTYLGRKIRLSLKPAIAASVSDELKQINFVYGLDSNIYWELVRKNTIKYWKDLDRHEIFDIEVL